MIREMTKKKHKDNEDTWQILSIILVGVIVLLIFFIAIKALVPNNYSNEDSNSNYNNDYQNENVLENVEEEYGCSDEYILCGDLCYKCSEGYYLGVDCQCYPTDDTLYELADEKWREYLSIINKDIEEVNRIGAQYCPDGMTYEQLPYCINNYEPRLNVYAEHVINAKNFLYEEGYIFSNKQTLLAGLDDDLVFINSQANYLKTLVNEYNAWVETQQNQQEINQAREQAIIDLLEILSGISLG